MAGKVKTWVWILVGLFVAGILCIIAVAGAGFYFFSRHIDTSKATVAEAATEFDRVRSRFANQKPLIEVDETGDFVRANTTDRKIPKNVTVPEALHILAYDPDDGGLVKLSIPFWLLRLNPEGARFNVRGNEMQLEDLKLTVRDLERYGSSLVLDQRNSGGDRVLVWTE